MNTDLLKLNVKGKMFQFKNQLSFLDNLEIFISSLSRTKCMMAYTNLKTLLFYKPGFRMLSLLSDFKVYPKSEIKDKFKLFWTEHYSEQLEMINTDIRIDNKRKNVKR
jgi:hypothetical protein